MFRKILYIFLLLSFNWLFSEYSVVKILPGSFVKAKILTAGAIPTKASGENMPVLLKTTGYVYLPSNNKALMNFCTLIGVAEGDISSSRVHIKLQKIAYIIDNKSFVQEVRGYIVDKYSMIGLEGKVIRNEGLVLAQSFGASILNGLVQILVADRIRNLNLFDINNYTNYNSFNTASASITAPFQNIADYYLRLANEYSARILFYNNQEVWVVFLSEFELITPEGLSDSSVNIEKDMNLLDSLK